MKVYVTRDKRESAMPAALWVSKPRWARKDEAWMPRPEQNWIDIPEAVANQLDLAPGERREYELVERKK